MAVRTLFGLLGLVVGLFGGWQAYDRTQSVVLAVFIGLMVAGYIGRGVADVITDPQKARRFVFFTLPVIFAIGGLAGAYTLWGVWWVAVVVGFILYLVGSMVAMVVFPRIAQEEVRDSNIRMGAEEQPSYPDENLNPLPSPYDNLKRF